MEMFDVLTENGSLTGKVASREEAHEKGLWHRAVVVFIINSKNEVLLQQRSSNKKLWPNLWDITAGGHVLENEFAYQAVIRETKEEIGIELSEKELIFLASATSVDVKNNIINRHFNEFFVVRKDINLEDISLQEEEVQDIKWFTKEEIIERIKNNYQDLTEKKDCWAYLLKYIEQAK